MLEAMVTTIATWRMMKNARILRVAVMSLMRMMMVIEMIGKRSRGRPTLGYCEAHVEMVESHYSRGEKYARPACGYDSLRVVYIREGIWDPEKLKFKYQFTAVGTVCTRCGNTVLDREVLRRAGRN